MKRMIFILAGLLLFLLGTIHADTISDGTITVSATAQGISTVSSDTKQAKIKIEGDSVRIGFKTAPTATTGMQMDDNDTMTVNGLHDVTSLRVILASGASSSSMHYILYNTLNPEN